MLFFTPLSLYFIIKRAFLSLFEINWFVIHLIPLKMFIIMYIHLHRRRQPQPGGPLQASSSSKSTSHIIHVLYLFFHKESIKMGPGHVRPL